MGVDLRQVGSRAYSTNTLESGWIPSPLPGIYTGDGMMQDYRDWLGADSYEAAGSIGGSFVSDNIADYYVNPFELGYDFYIGWKKDDFIGKAALEAMRGAKNRKKVTFEWNAEDVVNVISSAFRPGEDHYKWIDFPQPNYASSSADLILRDGKQVGMSMFNGYSYNERCMLSLGVVDADVEVGDVAAREHELVIGHRPQRAVLGLELDLVLFRHHAANLLGSAEDAVAARHRISGLGPARLEREAL